ncbi:MAG: phosphodiester glycosidase family protein [Bacteroidales bacterium]|jgi:uncharacterized protein YigE (DUF2233 family)|nr:phosphodiester glycosidase family protein [Bacteroidales bacterium]
MRLSGIFKWLSLPILIVIGFSFCYPHKTFEEEKYVYYVVNPSKQDMAFYWKDDTGAILKTFTNLKTFVESRDLELVFAVNGGMFTSNYSPKGLYIENGKLLHPLDRKNGKGNFYLKPNGVFYIDDNKKPHICQTAVFKYNKHIQYATQSGPMLVIDGKIHSAFKPHSKNLNIRNGVGILSDTSLLFVISKEPLTFYDFASFFLEKGCKQALFLDGMLSEMYLPEKNWVQLDTNFGVMIAVTKPITNQLPLSNE